jgi:flagella basal body P-ring formation protein FlgA
MTRTISALIGLTLLLGNAVAEETQDLETIQDAARQLIAADNADSSVQIEVGRLDPRLRLHRCDQAIEAFYPPGSNRHGNTTVGVRCNGSTPWSLYVPVRVLDMQTVIVAARNLPAGGLIDESDLGIETRDVTRLQGDYFNDIDQLVGKQLAHPLSAGQVMATRHIRVPNAIKRGQRVTLLANQNGFEVRMSGTAMDDAGVGERIRVKNLTSSRVVEGVVNEDGSIVVIF